MSDQHSGRFSIIPARACDDKRLTHRLLHLLVVMGTYSNPKGYCWPKQETLAKRSGVSRPAINIALRKLEEYGYITSKQEYNRNGSYAVKVYKILMDGDIERENYRSPDELSMDEAAVSPTLTPAVSVGLTPAVSPTLTHNVPSENVPFLTTHSERSLLRVAPATAVVASQPARSRTPDGGAIAQESKSEKQKQRAEREQSRATIWRALADAGLPEPHSRREIAGQNAAIYSLMTAGATHDRIAPAVAAFHALWPKAVCTVNALDKHWSLLMEGPKNETQRQVEEARRRDEAVRQRQRDHEARADAEHNSEEVQRLIRECLELPGPAHAAAG